MKEHSYGENVRLTKVSVSVGVSTCDQDVNLLHVLLLTEDNFITDKRFLNGFFNELILLQHRAFWQGVGQWKQVNAEIKLPWGMERIAE